MWVAMSAVEREEFLVGVHVGVLSAAMDTAGQTLAVPVWYSCQPVMRRRHRRESTPNSRPYRSSGTS